MQLSKKQKPAKKNKPLKKKEKTKSKKLASEDDVFMEDEIIRRTDGDEDEFDFDKPTIHQESVQETTPAVPFSDGIVSKCLEDLVAIPRVGGQDVEVLKGFLNYFHLTGTFIGTISTKSSFMKKKGGILL